MPKYKSATLKSMTFHCDEVGDVIIPESSLEWSWDGYDGNEDCDGWGNGIIYFDCDCGERHLVRVYENL